MQVEDSFRTYSEGIFEEPAVPRYVGGHAVKCLGWGADEARVAEGQSYIKSHYWICANSWSARWGDAGFFKIYMSSKIGYNAGYLRFDKGDNPIDGTFEVSE